MLPASTKVFRASVVKVDITPDKSQNLIGYNARKSTGIHDRIYHRIVALDDGYSRFFLVTTEICILSPLEYERVADSLASRLGIDRRNFWWTVTHTHSAPEVGPPGMYKVYLKERSQHNFDVAYTDMIVNKLISGVKEAMDNLAPAKLGVGWGFSKANINRRARDLDEKTFLGLNPDGPVDRKIGIIKIEKSDGTPLVTIANYPIHGTVMGGENLLISGDAPGVVAEYVEQKTGAPLVFVNGAAGNLAPIYTVYPSPEKGHLGQFRVMLGDRIIDASKNISATIDSITLKTGSLIVETPRKEGLSWPEGFENYTRKEGAVDLVRLPLRFFKINEDIAIWSAPLELFCEVSNEVRRNSPFTYTFFFGYTNGWFGYMLSDSEYKYSGYELTVSPFSSNGARDLTKAVIGYLGGEMSMDTAILAEEEYSSDFVNDVAEEPVAFTSPLPEKTLEFNETIISDPVTTASNSFYLITGSFKTEKMAMKQVELLEEDGFKPKVVAASNGFYRVVAMKCPDLRTAITWKDSISKKFPGTWISKKI